jgi:hypothetical protein
MKAAGGIIEGKYPWVAWLPCITHQADLIMKKIAKLEYQEVVTQVRGVCVWVRRHAVPLAVFKKWSPRVLQIPGETHYCGYSAMLEEICKSLQL